jgi:hypothetical protein
MPDDFAVVYATLKPVLAKYEKRLRVKADTPKEYTLLTQSPSPYPQHKGEPMYFASLRLGKAYVSVHFLPVYMCPEMNAKIGPALKKRMQGKACFNFKSVPDAEQLTELASLTAAGVEFWKEKNWL